MNKNIILAHCLFILNFNATHQEDCCQNAVKLVPEHRKIELLNKVGKNSATLYECQMAAGIVAQEYSKCIKAIERAHCQVVQAIKTFIAQEYDLQVLLSSIAQINQQLGLFLDGALALLKPVAQVEVHKSSYNTINLKRDIIKPLEIDPSPQVCRLFKQFAHQELCITTLKGQLKETFGILNTSGKLDKNALNLIRLTVLIKMLENPARAIMELSAKKPSELLTIAKAFAIAQSSVEQEKLITRGFLEAKDDWNLLAKHVRALDVMVMDFLKEQKSINEIGQDFFLIEEGWFLELEFFSKGLSYLSKDVRIAIEADRLLKAIVQKFSKSELDCFYSFQKESLVVSSCIKNKLTSLFRLFFDIVIAIGIETSLVEQICDSQPIFADLDQLKIMAESKRALIEIILSVSSNRPVTPACLIYSRESSQSSFSLRIRTSVDSRVYGPVRESIQKSIIETQARVGRAYQNLISIANWSILQYLSCTRDVDSLRHKIRIEANSCLLNLKVLLSQFNQLQANGCLREEFKTLEIYRLGFEFAYQNTSSFLAHIFKTKIAHTMDLEMREDDLLDAYREYQKAYKLAVPGKLLQAKQNLLSAVLVVQALKTPESLFSMSRVEQIRGFYTYAQQFYGLAK